MTAAAADSARRERRLSLAFSFVLHAVVLALLGAGWLHLAPRHPAPRQLAIEAFVMDRMPSTPEPAPSAAPAAAAQPAPVNPAPPPVQQAAEPPRPTQAEAKARMEHQEQQLAAARAREQQAHERELAAERDRAAAAQRAAAERAAIEQAAEQKAASERVAAEKAAQAKAAQERAAAERARREAADRARREEELRAQMASEERVNAARSSAEAASWLAAIRDRVTRAWIRPPGARGGLSCEVLVTQVPGGEVTGVRIGNCNGDAAVRESIEAAVYRASPLPSPSNQDLFDRNLRFTFHPDD
jgi:colicin import membrane protein